MRARACPRYGGRSSSWKIRRRTRSMNRRLRPRYLPKVDDDGPVVTAVELEADRSNASSLRRSGQDVHEIEDNCRAPERWVHIAEGGKGST
jgi:hypothetical protein